MSVYSPQVEDCSDIVVTFVLLYLIDMVNVFCKRYRNDSKVQYWSCLFKKKCNFDKLTLWMRRYTNFLIKYEQAPLFLKSGNHCWFISTWCLKKLVPCFRKNCLMQNRVESTIWFLLFLLLLLLWLWSCIWIVFVYTLLQIL